jgi:hypothetical protein
MQSVRQLVMPEIPEYQHTGTCNKTEHRHIILQLQTVRFKPENTHIFDKPAHRLYINNQYYTEISFP